MSCLGDCWDLGPPPDTILFIPPPPAPHYFQIKNYLLQNNITTQCATQSCDSFFSGLNVGETTGNIDTNFDINDYVEIDHHEVEPTSSWSGSDTWLLVVVASSIGVLLLGALLALFLLKCREEHRQQTKHLEQRQLPTAAAKARIQHPHNQHHQNNDNDNRMVWAALTPRGGTQHYVSDSTCSYRSQIPPPVPPPPQPHLISEPEDHYESIDEPNYNTISYPHRYTSKISSFDNTGFNDYDYEEPTPLMQLGYGQDMRCISTLRRLPPPPRPLVSSPTRIEHPNLPPLNLNPQLMTTKRGTLSRRPSDANAILKYNIN